MKGVATAIFLLAVSSVLIYELSHDSGNITFRVVVNDQERGSLTVEGINNWNGIDYDEAIRIADASFEFVMGGDVEKVLRSMNTTMGFVEAHYVWGYDAEDLGHVFNMKANLWTGTIIVTHCR